MSKRPEFERKWFDRFKEFAERRDDDAGIAGWSSTGLGARLRRFESLWADSEARGLWLDVGCGAGTYCGLLAAHGLRVIGLDYNPLAVGKARDRQTRTIQWVVGDATKLAIRTNTMDGVLCFGVAQSLADPKPCIREIARVLKPGGILWMDALNQWCIASIATRATRGVRRRPRHLRYDSPWGLSRLLAGIGFQKLELYWLPIFPARFNPLQQAIERMGVANRFGRSSPVGAALSHSFLLRGILLNGPDVET